MPPKQNPDYVYLPTGGKQLVPHSWRVCPGCGETKLIRIRARTCSRVCGTKLQHREGRSRQASGAEHYAWKGSDAGYQSLHNRVIRQRGRADRCEWRDQAICSSVKYEWAHVHGTDPGDPQNYVSLCKTCHQRYDKQTGADNAQAKLTSGQVAAIRAMYAAGGVSQQALGALYGIHQTAISNIVRGVTYRSA